MTMKSQIGKLLLALFTFTLISAVAPVVDAYKVGEQAADFSLKNVDGSMVSLADYKGVNGYIVVFTCNTCPTQKCTKTGLLRCIISMLHKVTRL